MDFEPELLASDEEGIKLGHTSPNLPTLGHIHVHTCFHSTPIQSCTPVESVMITHRLQAEIIIIIIIIIWGGVDVLCDMRMNGWVGVNIITFWPNITAAAMVSRWQISSEMDDIDGVDNI